MSRHNGVVTCVKFSPDGRFLASGSDDKIVLIWEKDDDQPRPKQFGEAEADLEHWTVRKRLVAHDNDVQDICWSPDGSLLITVGLDRSIIIWSGVTFERIKRYDVHQSMVKGIVFDPANKFFATASDDRSVRIFRYYHKANDSSGGYEFQMEQIIMEPFKKSPLTSYFRRMSWSPDGQHIAVPNATNGPVTSVLIINRGDWAHDISLIGHEAPCEVCSFSPRLFRSESSSQEFTTILASGGQDRTLAVWSTSATKPLVVAEDIVESSITDICWTPSGEALFVSSLDGTITCVIFDENELGEVVSEDVNDIQLLRYGGDKDSAIFAESIDQLKLESMASKNAVNKPAEDKIEHAEQIPALVSAPRSVTPQPSMPAPAINNLTPKQVNKLTQSVKITKDGKKRVTPILVSTYRDKSTPTPVARVSKSFDISSKVSQTSYYLPRLGLQTSVHGLRLRAHRAGLTIGQKEDDQDNDNEDMGLDDPTFTQLQPHSTTSHRKRLRKYRRLLMIQKYPTPFKMVSSLPEMLFSNRNVMNYELSRLLQNKEVTPLSNSDMLNAAALESIDENLVFQVVVNSIEHVKSSTIEDPQSSPPEMVTSIVEVRNGPSWPDDEDMLSTDFSQRLDFQDPTQVIVTNSEADATKSYILYFPYKIQQVFPVILEKKLVYYFLISFDGTVQIIHAESGNYFLPGIELGNNVVVCKQKGNHILLLISLGLIYCYKFLGHGSRRLIPVLKGVSIAPVLNCETTFEIPKSGTTDKERRAAPVPDVLVENVKAIELDENTGMPYVVLEKSNNVYTYSTQMKIWTKCIDSWYYLAMSKEDLASLNASHLTTDLVNRTFNTTQESIKKGQKGQYLFNASNAELRLVMLLRFKELLEIV